MSPRVVAHGLSGFYGVYDICIAQAFMVVIFYISPGRRILEFCLCFEWRSSTYKYHLHLLLGAEMNIMHNSFFDT